MNVKTLVIIPAFNEAESIELTIKSLCAFIKKSDNHIEYIIVDDCSTDATPDILNKNKYAHLTHPTNMGVGAAIQTGIRYAIKNDFNYVTQFDADGQHIPQYINDLIYEAEKGYDIVIGSRFLNNKKHLSFRMLGSKVLSNMIYARSGFKQKITDPTSGQRIINKKIQRLYLLDNYSSEPSFIIKYFAKGHKIKEIQVTMNDRENGTSHFNFYNSVMFMLEQCIAIVFGY